LATWSDTKDDVICLKWVGDMGAKIRAKLERTKANDLNLDEDTRTAVGEYVNYDGKYLSYDGPGPSLSADVK